MNCVCMETSVCIPQAISGRYEWCHYQPRLGSWWMYRIGKKKAGRLLDGRLWDQSPPALLRVNSALGNDAHIHTGNADLLFQPENPSFCVF